MAFGRDSPDPVIPNWFIDDITNNLDVGRQTDCLIMDFNKAFDKVSHCLLTHKLDHYGVRGKSNIWIRNFLSNRKQTVVVEGETSDYINVESGIPQGSVLGPSLFLYINDMPENIKSTVRLFADDTIVYLTITSDVDRLHLQEDLDRLAHWEQTWKMSFHPEKCNVLSITKKRNPVTNCYILHGHQLEQVQSAKYLGVSITNICKKASNTLSFLKRNLNISNSNLKEKAYQSLVRPTLEYACTTWNPYHQNNKHRIEMVQRRAARYVKNRYHNTSGSSVTEIIGQLQWTSLEERRKTARLILLYKISNGLVKIDAPDRLITPTRFSRNMHRKSFQIPACHTTARRETFYPRTIFLFIYKGLECSSSHYSDRHEFCHFEDSAPTVISGVLFLFAPL
jgi:hypothetical protein